MSALLLDKRSADGDQDVPNRIALSDERDFERLLETALPLVRPLVRHIKRMIGLGREQLRETPETNAWWLLNRPERKRLSFFQSRIQVIDKI